VDAAQGRGVGVLGGQGGGVGGGADPAGVFPHRTWRCVLWFVSSGVFFVGGWGGGWGWWGGG
jgi:hypothetical protein